VPETLEIIFVRTWWQYTPEDGQWFTTIYHWFNVAEGCAWVVCAGLVFRRFLTHQKSPSEIYYAIAFLAFAVTDFAEAWKQSSWLIWLKLLNLIVLFQLRRKIMSRYYPKAKLY
jgi:multisubunit Na+/H+ antiporter MnhE subunit